MGVFAAFVGVAAGIATRERWGVDGDGWAILLHVGAAIVCARVAAGCAADVARGQGQRRRMNVLWLGVLCHGLMGASLGRIVAAPMAAPGHVRAAALPAGAALLEVTALSAGWPGVRCQVYARVGTQRWNLRLPASACPIARGDVLTIPASALRSTLTRHPGGTPAPARARAAGVNGHAEVDMVWRRWGRAPSWWGARVVQRWSRSVAALRARAWAWSRGDVGASFVIAATLGMPSALPPEVRADLRGAGLSHLLAVSGLHVSFAFALAFGLMTRAFGVWGRAGVAGAGLVGTFALVAYASLTGFSPSVVRAACSRMEVTWGYMVGAGSHPLQRLAWVGTLVLLARPGWLFSPGFQLSFTAAAALATQPQPSRAWLGSLRVSCATAPLCWLHFGDPVAIGAVTNLLAVPWFSFVLAPLMVVGWSLVPLFGLPALSLSAWVAALLPWLSRHVASVPAVPTAWMLGGLGLAWVAGLRWSRWRGAVPGWALLLWAIPGGEGGGAGGGEGGGAGGIATNSTLVVAGTRHASVLHLSAREICVASLGIRSDAIASWVSRDAPGGSMTLTMAVPPAPHARAFAEQFVRRGVSVRWVDTCAAETLDVAGIASTCRARQPPGHRRASIVAQVDPRGEVACLVDGRWRTRTGGSLDAG